tara:strand:- start:761 stop:1060 length:300 start_codon:yes stop_codon:yes gene_type:complete
MTTLNKKENRLLEQYLLLQQLKQRLEDSWSGASQVIEELEDFKYTHEEAVKLERNIFDKLDTFYTYDLEDLKEEAEVLQGKIQEAIDKFVNTFNLKDEV